MFLDPTVHLDWSSVPERQLQLMDAAERLFAKQGYDDTPVSAIVAAVGVSQGTFYNYFESKSALLDAICDRFSEELRLGLEEELATPGGAVDRMVGVSLRFQAMARDRAELFHLIHEERNELLHARLERHNRPWLISAYRRLVDQGVAEGIYSVDHPQATALALLYAMNGIGDHLLQEDDPAEQTHLFQAATSIAERILGAPKGTFTAAFAAQERP